MALHKNRPAIGIKSNVALPQLDRDLTRSRRRAGRLWRSYQRIDEKRDPAGSAATHLEWSDAVEMTLKIVDAISREQAHDLGELRVQFDAICGGSSRMTVFSTPVLGAGSGVSDALCTSLSRRNELG